MLRKTGTSLLVLLFLASALFGQKTVIMGIAQGAERKQISVTVPGDLITLWEKPLVSGKIDSTGHFMLSCTLAKTTNATISIDFHKVELLLEPGKSYDLMIAAMNYDEFEEVNPFIQSQNLTLEGLSDPKDLNITIGNFNAMYSTFLTEHFSALYRDRNKVLLDTFRIRMNQEFGSEKNEYFLVYAAYKIASLEQLTQYYNKAQLAKKYFTDKPIEYYNLEYMDFFNSFFSKYLSTSNALRKVDLQPIIKGPDPYKGLMKVLATDTVLKNEQLRELVMLKGLMELYGTIGYDPEQVLSVIRKVPENTRYPDNRTIAEDMISQMTRLKPGTLAPEFTLKDRNEKMVSLKSLRGKPTVLWFWTTYCQGCLSEMDLIGTLFDKYRENLNFVAVSADKSFYKMKFFIDNKKDYTWTFLNTGEQSDVLKDYDVRTYPLFILLDRDGKIVKYQASEPSEGLEAEIQKLLQQ